MGESDATATDPRRGNAEFASTVREVPKPRAPRAELRTVDPALYNLGAEIAHGGMGRIRAAVDQRLGREVAIKELLDPKSLDAARFEREAFVTASLQHPSIVSVYEAGRWPSGEPFYAMKLVRGSSFKSVMNGAEDYAARLALLPHVIAVADAMAYAHEHRIVHRDLKPSNVLVGDFGETVVIDWGLAKDLAAGDEQPSGVTHSSDAELTRAGSVMGTPSYMAPEQAAGESVDERADVYAIGAMLYQLLSGTPPFTGASSDDVLAKVKTEAPRPLRTRVPGVSADLVAIVERAMARDAKDRYPTGRELADDLRRFQTGQLVASHRYTRRELVRRFIRRHRMALSIISISLLVLASVGAYSVRRIVAERDVAREAKRVADSERAIAEQQRARAIESSDNAVIVGASNLLRQNPRQALSLLSTLSPGSQQLATARMLASDARRLGPPRIRPDHSDYILDVALSADGKQLATASGDGTVRVWDATTLESRVVGKHDDRVELVVFSPDGQHVASSSIDRTARVWNLRTGASRTFVHRYRVLDLAFASDTVLITQGFDTVVRWWDVADATKPQREHVDSDEDRSQLASGAFQFAPDRRRFAYVVRRGVRVIDVATGRAELYEQAGVAGFAFSPDGARLVTASSAGELMSWDLTTHRGQQLAKLGAHEESRRFAFSPDGRSVAMLDQDSVLVIGEGKPRVLGKVMTHPRGMLEFSRDGRWLAHVGDNLELWNSDTWEARTMFGARERVHAVTFTNDELIGISSNAVFAWPLHDRTERVVTRHERARQVTFRADGKLASSGRDSVRIDDTAVAAFAKRVGRVAVAGNRMAALGDDGIVRVVEGNGSPRTLDGALDVRPREFPRNGVTRDEIQWPGGSKSVSASIVRDVRWAREEAGAVDYVRFSPDAKHVAASGIQGGTVHVWNLETNARTTFDAGATDIEAVLFAADGQRLAIGDAEGRIHIIGLDARTQHTLTGHTAAIEQLAFSSDGKRLISVAAERSVWTWDLVRGQGKAHGTGNGPFGTLAATADGTRFAAGGADNMVRMWRSSTSDADALPVDASVMALAFHPQGEQLAIGGSDGTITLWLVDSATFRTIPASSSVLDLAWSADGKHLAAAYADGTVRLHSDDLPRDEASLRSWIVNATR